MMALRERLAVAALAGVSVAAYGHVAYSLAPERIDSVFQRSAGYGSAAPAVMVAAKPINAGQFAQQIENLSRDHMVIVMPHRSACPSCAGVHDALEYIRYKTFDMPFTLYRVDIDRNPEIESWLGPRPLEGEARFHVFYNGKKIHESLGVSTDPLLVFSYLDGVRGLITGEVSHLNPYQPAP